MNASVTASVGIATLPLSGVVSEYAEHAFHQLVAEADTAMYEAKRCGGNRTRHRQVAV
jgi:GGDEF domain-containing protein